MAKARRPEAPDMTNNGRGGTTTAAADEAAEAPVVTVSVGDVPVPIRPNVTRCRDRDGFRGTVRYLGPVASATDSSEIYAGVEWDDRARGKHDGSVVCRRTNRFVRHFSCSATGDNGEGAGTATGEGGAATAASFVRMRKLDLGVPLDGRLLEGRYVAEDAELVAPDNLFPDCYANTSGGREKKPIELVGEMQIRRRQQLADLGHVSLRCLGVSRMGTVMSSDETTRMGGGYGHLKSMDLAGNLLCDWADVASILRHFPNLESVSLASNRINDLVDDGVLLRGNSNGGCDPVDLGFDRIQTLNLNDCNVRSFRTPMRLDGVMPNLTELCVAHNDLSDLDSFDRGGDDDAATAATGAPPPGAHTIEGEARGARPMPPPLPDGVFANLRLFDMSACRITSWDMQVSRLGRLPNLETLILDDNPITRVTVPPTHGGEDGGADDRHFANLTSLQLAGTAISDWADAEGVRHLPSLRSLRFRNCPLTSNMGSSAEARAVIIARLCHPAPVEFLNASPVGTRERDEAERRYVRGVAREMDAAERVSRSESSGANGSSSAGGNDGDRRAEEAKGRDAQSIVRAKHPRFDELVRKHGEGILVGASSASSRAGGGRLADEAVNVTVRSMVPGSCTADPLRRRLPGSMSVGQVKGMCARAFGLDVDSQVLHFHRRADDGRKDAFPSELDDDANPLSYYGVNDGAEILMNEATTTAN